ncbi:hypothetical protein ACN42_g7425 [Penicillium freii]|uniref:Uncharacterized protein n=1 Tax=Penicillium freii TaxID=48697 RepID=A0A101MFM2_PENFR|nr:hypothetical protein ACN42_g7425 [Penicillium freii]
MGLWLSPITVSNCSIKASSIAKSVEINSGVEAHRLAHRLPDANTSLTNMLHKSTIARAPAPNPLTQNP